MVGMILRARLLAVQILAASLCLLVPWPSFAAEAAPAVAAEAAAGPAGFDPLFHQELQLTVDRLFPAGAQPGAQSLQALRVMQAEYDAAASAAKPEPASRARAEAARFLAQSLQDAPKALSQRLEAAGVPRVSAHRIGAASGVLHAEAARSRAVANALRQVFNPLAGGSRAASRAQAMISRAKSLWRAPQPALVLAGGSPVAQALAAQRPARQARAALEWPLSPRARAMSGGADWVPTAKKVAQLQKLAKTDFDAAFAQAAQILSNQDEPRIEVRASAFRLVAGQPAVRALPIVLKLLQEDPSWYLKRMSAKWLGARAGELGESKGVAEKALRESYRNANPSVRVMSGWALRQLGVDPGPEVAPAAVRVVPAVSTNVLGLKDSRGQGPNNPNPGSRVRRIFFSMTMLLGAVIIATMLMSPASKSQNAPPAQPQTQSQVVSQPAPAAGTPQDQILAQMNKNLEGIKQANQQQAEEIHEMHVESQKKGGNGLMFTLFLAFAPILFMVWLMRKMMSGAGGKGGSMLNPAGKTNIDIEHPNVRFSDVAGVDDALNDVRQVTDFLENPGKYRKLGVHPPRGILLEGPPGTGKTLMARALAGEANAAFLSMKGSDFIQMFVGVGANRVRELFDEARKNQPAIVFIDEIDAIGSSRENAGPSNGGSSEHRQTLIALLAELDGFMKMDNVIVMAATNRAQDLDEALTRPGRFDRKIFVGNPDVLGREAILAVHAAKLRLGPDADVEFTAKRTPGLSGAAMANIVNEAGLQAARADASQIDQKHLQRAVDKETFGDERNLFLDEKTKRRVAEHESGHALAQFFAMLKRKLEGVKVDNKITIIPHGKAALGYAEKAQRGEADTYLQTQDELEADIVGAMGGRGAEETIYPGKKGVSTGPGSDIADHADRIARVMVEQLGMSDKVGIINAGPDARDPMGRSRLSEQTKQDVDSEIKRITREALEEAKQHIRENRERFDRLVQELYEKETLFQEQIEDILAGPLPARPTAPNPEPAK